MTKDEDPAINIEGIIHLQTSSFSSSYSAPGVVCLLLCTSGGLAREGKHPLLDNFSMKILCYLIDFDTNGQSRPRPTQ